MDKIAEQTANKKQIESYSQIVERSMEKANNGKLNIETRVRMTRKHGSQCEGMKHGLN
jgi:hypothetical protein